MVPGANGSRMALAVRFGERHPKNETARPGGIAIEMIRSGSTA